MWPRSSLVATCSMTARARSRQSKFRTDVQVIGVPLTEISNAAYTDPRQRQLFKNIIYVGALSVLLDVDADVFETLFGEQYKGKERLLDSNIGLAPGARLRETTSGIPLGIARRRSDKVGDQIFTDGNSAAALGLHLRRRDRGGLVPDHAVVVGARGVSEVLRQIPGRPRDRPAQLRHRAGRRRVGLHRHGGGAGWNGARAFTATSGPGVSLMTEFIGLAYFAEIPVTIINVQRGGPSTGMPTRTQQSDLMFLRLCLARRHQACAAFPAGPA
jgi:2-oxoglutarate ferredoxin oxidoreductase subunit alpha